jgi:hypothetical protein
VTVSEPESCNCAALRQAARRVTRLYDEALTPVGIGLNQFSILSRIARIDIAFLGTVAASATDMGIGIAGFTRLIGV